MPAAASLKVLVVDDQQTMRSLVRSGLQQLGFKDIRECGDGEDGLRAMLTSKAHLVISDFNMPKLDGLGLLRAIRAHEPIRGVATSGRHGRSFSLGIADAVTVLAADAAGADAAATVIANAVDLFGHPAVRRVPASDLEPDSDLGSRLITAEVGPLGAGEVARALAAGVEEAERLRADGLIAAAVLCLDDQVAAVASPVLASAVGG